MKNKNRLKYNSAIEALQDDVYYTPFTIAREAIVANPRWNLLFVELEMERIAKRLPWMPDSVVEVRGKSPTKAWLGWRWKKLLESLK